MAGGSGPADTHTHAHTHGGVHCFLMRACEVRGRDDLKVRGTYGGADTEVLDCACG